MTGEPTYIELGTPDAAAAMSFYASLFGWGMTDMPGGGSASTSTLGIGFHGGDPATHHEVFYAVADLETSSALVKDLGGSINGDVHDSPGFGRWVECSDNQGAPFGIVVQVAASPPPQVWPCIFAADARALITFLIEAFGFIEVEVYGEGSVVDHAELAWPEGGGIMLGSINPDARTVRTAGSFEGYVVTATPDALHARAIAAGATSYLELHDTDYGSRSFAVTDIEGNLWSFGTYRGAPVPR